RGEATLEHDAGFRLLERREPALQLYVNRHGARDRAHGSGAGAELLHCLDRPLPQLRMRRQAEVVVRGEVDDLTVVERGLVALLTFEDSEMPVEALLLERIQLRGEMSKRIETHQSSVSS